MAKALDAELAKKEAIMSVSELIDAIEAINDAETVELAIASIESLKQLLKTANKWNL